MEDEELDVEDSGPEPTRLPNAVWEKAWTLRGVVSQMEKKNISDIIGAPPRSSKYLSSYSNAVSEVIRGLGDETKEEYTRLAKIWNQTGPPPEIQRRYF